MNTRNTKRIFWRFWYCNRVWSQGKLFGFCYADDQIHGVLYCGVILFGRGLVYSDHW